MTRCIGGRDCAWQQAFFRRIECPFPPHFTSGLTRKPLLQKFEWPGTPRGRAVLLHADSRSLADDFSHHTPGAHHSNGPKCPKGRADITAGHEQVRHIATVQAPKEYPTKARHAEVDPRAEFRLSPPWAMNDPRNTYARNQDADDAGRDTRVTGTKPSLNSTRFSMSSSLRMMSPISRRDS